MPKDFSDTRSFRRHVMALCDLPWASSQRLQQRLPSRWFVTLFRGSAWTQKQVRDYDAAVRRSSKGKGFRREDVKNPGFVHRITFQYVGDDGIAHDATNLALVARGGRRADFLSRDGTAQHAKKDAFDKFRLDLRTRWDRCMKAYNSGRLAGSHEVREFELYFQLIYKRRYALLARELRKAGGPGQEVLANSARQCLEITKYIEAFSDDLTLQSEGLEYGPQVQYVGGRFKALYGPAVAVVLQSDLYTTSADAFALREAPPPPGSARDAGSDGAGAGSQTVVTAHAPPPQPLHSTAQQHTFYGTQVSGPAMGAWPVPLGFAPPPALPPPAYIPPPPYSAPPPAASTPTTGVTASYGRRSLTFADGSGGTASGGGGPPPPAAPGVVRAEPKQGFCGKPGHAWVCWLKACAGGATVVPHQQVLEPRCRCYRKPEMAALPAPGPHATWDCPLRYWSVCGECPGFLRNGQRDPAAWNGDEITEATRAAWRVLSGRLPLARSALGHEPNFS